jgi:alkylation response protein AidB-like acyl-CoA dehydrogenase
LPTPEARFQAIRPFFEEMVRAGFMKGMIPVRDGGTYTSLLEVAIGGEEATIGDVNVACSLFSCGLALQPIIQFGSDEQRRKYLAPFLVNDGAPLAAFGFSEVGGSAKIDDPDPSAGIKTLARREGDEWVISGQKHFTTNGFGWSGEGADLYTVVCRTDPSAPPEKSLAVIAVPRPKLGVSYGKSLDTMGHRACLSPRVIFDEVRVPIGNMIGKPGDGVAIATKTFSGTAAMVGVGAVAIMRQAFEAAWRFARSDRRNGAKPIIEHQNVGFMLADIKMVSRQPAISCGKRPTTLTRLTAPAARFRSWPKSIARNWPFRWFTMLCASLASRAMSMNCRSRACCKTSWRFRYTMAATWAYAGVNCTIF